ncbi:MAG: DUF255 domain-containing protein [Lentimicrobium sp.]|jgi:thioredoxin-related protein|nr:DUF255 domain-containing protein [Lentimicrobium sp.]
MKKSLLLAVLFLAVTNFISLSLKGQTTAATSKKTDGIRWMSFEEAIALNKKKPKMIFIDFYTDWCGWCKKMDAETFADKEIISYINKKYYAVKFNAEQTEPVIFKDQEFVNPNPGKARSTHKLTLALLKNEKLYPSYVILDKNSDWTYKLKGYKSATDLLPILRYYGDEEYKTLTWGEYLQKKQQP